jgi:hypothetical protein
MVDLLPGGDSPAGDADLPAFRSSVVEDLWSMGIEAAARADDFTRPAAS